MKVSDVLQYDSGTDGIMNHTMFVTKKSFGPFPVDYRPLPRGFELYLTFHTSNTLNKPLSLILDQHPGVKWYAWRT